MLKTLFINSTEAQYTDEDFSWLQKFFIEAGVLGDSSGNLGLGVTQKGSGANMSVDVALGNALVSHTRNSITWKVIVESNATSNVVISANSSGSNRIDAIILRVSRSATPNSLKNNVATIEVVTGTGVSALSDGAITTAIGSDDFIRLANITVANGASSIVTGNIADTRVQCKTNESITLAPKNLKFTVQASDPASPVEGQIWYNSTTHTLNFYNNSIVKQLGSTQGQYNPLLVSAQSSPNMTLAVAQGNVRFGIKNVNFAGGNSPTFVAPVSASNKRIDLLCLDLTGTLSIVTGTDTTGSPTVPNYPLNLFVIAEVYLRNGMTSIKTLDDSTNGYIYNDARGFSVPTVNDYGDGSDGDVTISVDTTLTRDMFYNNLTVNTGINLNSGGYRIFVKDTLTMSGTAKISRNGGNGTNAVTTTPGNGGTLAAGSLAGGTSGGNGSASPSGDSATGLTPSAASNLVSSLGVASTSHSTTLAGKGGTNSSGTGLGGNNGGANTRSLPMFVLNVINLINQIDYIIGTGIGYMQSSAKANGGGSGGNGYSSSGGSFGTGGAGGGGASSGGILFVAARNIVETANSRFEAKGGVGGNGGNGTDGGVDGGTSRGGGGGGNGGDGGNGGVIILIYLNRNGSSVNCDVSGGVGGTKGNHGGDWNGSGAITSASTDGTNGVTGQTGVIYTRIG